MDGHLWLADCYFAHNSLGFPVLLLSSTSVLTPGRLARTWRRSFPTSCGVALLGGVKLEARIKPPGNSSFEFTAEGKGINLTTLANPVHRGADNRQ